MLQVKDASTKSFWPALCAMGASAVAAYAVVFWVLQIQSFNAPASQAPVVMNAASDKAALDSGANAHVALALGAAKPSSNPTQALPAERQWNLLGVVAGVSGQGSALIAVDGQPPKAYLPGQTVAPGWVLHSVGQKQARLAPSLQEAPTLTLQLSP